MSVITIGFRRESVSFSAALGTKGPLCDGTAVAIVAGADAVGFAVVKPDGGLDYGPGASAPADPFEIRVFNGSAELRWVRRPGPGNEGTAVLLVAKGQPRPGGWDDAATIDADVVDLRAGEGQRYLLWGTVERVERNAAPAWAVLFEGRVGEVAVPLSGAVPGDRVVLRYEEVLAVDDDFGNVAVRAERLLRLERLPGPTTLPTTGAGAAAEAEV